MSIEQAYNFKVIDLKTTSSGVISAEQLQQLSNLNYQWVINLLPSDSEYATADEQQLVEDQKIAYRHIPVDFAKPTGTDYEKFSLAMQQAGGKKTHIHCAANYRASAFFAIYAYQNLNWTTAQAKEHIESLWQPADYPNWLALLKEMIDGYQ